MSNFFLNFTPQIFQCFSPPQLLGHLALKNTQLAAHNGWLGLRSPYIFVESETSSSPHAECLTSHQAQNQFAVETVKLFEENMSKTFLFSD